jgi:alpha-galactosidase
VSPDAWPDGLAPLIDHVRGLGMEFGIWVEPEMVNPDSDLYRQHPDWALVDQRYPLVLGRNQLVLDLGRAEVRDHLFGQLDALLRDHDIAYLKWDHNRDLVAPVSLGRAGVHRQTMGAYELLDRLRAAHPDVDIETCASGGGRVDFGILDRTDRVWTSDSIDALDRLSIQRGFSLLFPPELMGSHVGAPVTHTTKRTHRLGFRALVAIFGAFGVEWNLLEASDDDLDQLAEIVALHKRFRPLLHGGQVLRSDHPDPSVHIHGVIADGRREALVAVARLTSSATHHTPPVQVPGLDDDLTYEVSIVTEVGEPLGHARRQPQWTEGKLVATQRLPENGILVHLQATGPQGRADV